MPLSALTPAPGGFQTKQALVAETLRRGILEGALAPGERLVIDDIAAALQVSPIPVREALRALQQEGLIPMRPHAGAVVAGMDKEAIRELFALMESLEVVAVRSAVQRIDSAGLDRLRGFATAMRRAAKARDHNAWAAANRDFHRAIVAIANLPLVAEFTERVLSQWDRLRRLAYREATFDRASADAEHDAIIAAFAAKDGEGLERLVLQHNRGALVGYLGGSGY